MKWGILGTGRIARVFAAALRESGSDDVLSAIASRNPHAIARAEDFHGATVFGSYAALLDDARIEAVYIATPHSLHCESGRAALAAGKHVLCEKPIGTSVEDALALVAEARRADRFLAEAFMYRHAPLTQALVDILQSGTIGRLCLAEAGTGIKAARDPAARLFDPGLGGGAILDLGGYPMSIMRLIAGVHSGKPFAEPAGMCGAAHFGLTGVEEWAAATLAFDDGFLAQVRCGITVAQDNVLRIWGEEGSIVVTSPFFSGIHGRPSGKIEVVPREAPARTIDFAGAVSPFVAQIRNVSRAAREGRLEPEWPAMSWADTIENMRTLIRWRDCVRTGAT